MNLTAFAIKQDRLTLVLVTILLLAGIQAYVALPKEQDPGFIIRTAVITTRLPGASPERVELLVTDKIEKKVQEMPEVDKITSESRTGISIIHVDFKESYKVMRPIFDDLRRKVADVEKDLPDGVDGPNVNDEFGDVFGSVYALTGDGYSYRELKDIADDIRDRLLRLDGVAKVVINGTQKEVIYVEYNNARLLELGLSPQQLAAVLADVNILASGGNVISGRERIVLEPSGNFESVEELTRAVVPLPSGALVYLGDIAHIYRAYVDPADSVTRVNGKQSLAISVSMRDGGDILKLGEELDSLMGGIQAEYPWGVELEKVWFQADLVETNVGNFVSSLLQAIAIVIAVMILTLGFRTGMVVATLIPSAMIITFFLMQQFGISINQISLAALIISLGLLVDNAIVMVESVLVKREQGATALDAAVQSGSELFMPLLTSSLTTAAAFMPIALAESSVGEYTSDIFYVVTLTLLTSWFLAMTFIPMLTMFALRCGPAAAENTEQFSGRWYRFYSGILLASLRHKARFGLIVVGIFVLAIKGMGLVPQVFIAPSEDPVFTGKFEMPLGTSIESSQEVMAAIDEYITEHHYADGATGARIKNWLTFIGEGGPRFMLSLNPPSVNPANSFLVASAENGPEVEAIIASVESFVQEQFPDLNVQLARLENGPPVGYPIVVRLAGPEFESIYEMAADVSAHLYEIPEVFAVKNTWGPQTKKLLVEVDQDRARRSGVSSNDVAYSLNASLKGIDMTEYREGDQLIPVRLRSVAADRQDIGKLDGLNIYSQTTGRSVPLKQVADVRLAFEPGIVERRDRDRTLSLKIQLKPGVTASEVNAKLLPWLEQSAGAWPADHYFELGGEAEESGEANASIAAKLPIAGMFIILLLVAQFNSVRRPIIILTTIPLGLIGVTFGLLVAKSTFGFFTLLGLISLSGIIINNAIVLIDRIKIEIDELHKAPAEAVLAACQHRLRPIMLTTATTVLGMMPLWWGGTAMFRPMAITIIFGLLFASLLTLLVVPVLYAGLFRVKYDKAVG